MSAHTVVGGVSLADAPKAIKAVRFGLLSADDIVARSVCHIDVTTIYQKSMPCFNGLNDVRMGTVDRRLACGTCGHGVVDCCGHPGHRQLTVPCYHWCFLEKVYKILKIVCYFCSTLLVTSSPGPRGRAAFVAVTGTTAKTAKLCPACQAPQPHYTLKKQATSIRLAWPSVAGLSADEATAVADVKFTPYRAWLILRKISDDDVRGMGLDPATAHPERLIIRVLSIPPPCVRPSIMVTEGSRSMGMDDLTHMLRDIIKVDVSIAEEMAAREEAGVDYVQQIMAPSPALEQKWQALQDFLNVYFAQDNPSVMKGSGSMVRKRKNLKTRLTGKAGRTRGNLNGKRVNQSARTVISPEAQLDINQLGVPEHVAMTLTRTELVCPVNFQAMLECVRRGPGVPGGAKEVITKEGKVVRLDMMLDRSRLRLAYGDRVSRHLRNGDPILFNRQPSLHKLSLISLNVKILPGKTFKLNVISTTPFNADFDGDEMNAHVPQDPLANVELQELMAHEKHIVTPQNSEVIVNLKQDSLLGVFLLCLPEVFLTREQYCQVVMAIQYPTRAPCVPASHCAGARVLDMVLLPHMNLRRAGLVIRDGRIVEGRIVQSAAKGIIHYFWKRSPEAACHALSDLQRISNAYLLIRGFSVGLWDSMTSASTRQALRAMLHKVDTLTDHIQREGAAAGLPAHQIEPPMATILASAVNYAGQVCQSALAVGAPCATNNIQAMVSSGSKGSMVNVAQLMGVVGQQFVDGRRPQGRLPCFAPDDTSPDARGFCRRSYMQGLGPAEFFFHAMGGREGLVDTSVKTASTGYMQRKLVKCMESHRMAYDGTVRNSNNQVIQYLYGGDNYDATHLVKHDLPLMAMSDEAVRAEAATLDETMRLVLLRDAFRASRPLSGVRTKLQREVHVPFHAQWILDQVADGHDAGGAEVTDPVWAYEWMSRLLAEVDEASPTHAGVGAMLRAYLAWHYRWRAIRGLKHKRLKFLASRVVAAMHRATIAPMEMVGALAAEMCGEPATQLTLNTFHTCGALHSVNLGVPRLYELLNLNKRSKTPSMTCPLLPPFCHDERYAMMLSRNMPFTVLHQVVRASVVTRDSASDMEALRAIVDADFAAARARDRLSPWVMSFELDMEAMLPRDMTPSVVAARLTAPLDAYFTSLVMEKKAKARKPKKAVDEPRERRYWLMASVWTDEQWRLVIRVRNAPGLDAMVMQEHLHRVLEMQVCGVAGVTYAQAMRLPREEVDDTGALVLRHHWAIVTTGVNLLAIGLTPTVDMANVVCNEVHDVWVMYGMEAAAKLLYYEIKRVLSFDSTNLHDRHIMLIVHTMTRHSDLVSMNRHGLKKQPTGPLVRSSFEQTVDVLAEAALFGERDDMAGVSENIIMGSLAPIGTGGMDIVETRGAAPRDDAVDYVSSKIDELLPDEELPKPLLSATPVAPAPSYSTYCELDVGAYCPSSPPTHCGDTSLDLVYCPSSP